MWKINAAFAGITLVGLLLVPLAFASAETRRDFQDGKLFETELTAGEETRDATPAVATGHAGAWFANDGDYFNSWLSVFSEEPILGAHFHCAAAGSDGPVVARLDNLQNGTTSTRVYGEIGRGYLSDNDIEPTGAGCAATIGYPIASVADLARAMLDGYIYANVHTPTYPAGAARGQLTLQQSNELDLRIRPPRDPRPLFR